MSDVKFVPITNGMNVKHGTEARLTVKSGDRILEQRMTPVEALGGAITVASIMYNALSVSGGTRWAHPQTGRAIRRPTWTAEVDESCVLAPGQECDCERCLA